MTDRPVPPSSPAPEPAGALAERIAAVLRTDRFGRTLHVHALAASTNDLARDLAVAGAAEGTAVLALEQSAGRGRLGRRWFSPRGGLYLSLVLRPRFPVERWPLIGLAAALGTAAAADACLAGAGGRAEARLEPEGAGPAVRLKWPNDLLLDGRKVGGILTEAVGETVVCGIGVNVVPVWSVPGPGGGERAGARARPEAPRVSTSGGEGMAEAAWLAVRNPAVSVEALVPLVLLECERRYARLAVDPDGVLAEWRGRAVTLGRRVRVGGLEPFEGVAVDVDAGGALLVRAAGGLRRVQAGDVVTHEADAAAEGGPSSHAGPWLRGGEV